MTGEKSIAVALLSGGLDSAVALAWALREGHECAALTIDYGQRHRWESAAASRVAASLGVPERMRRLVRIDLRAVGGSALTGEALVPKGRDEGAIGEGVPVTYVPARNMTFLSVAMGLAEALASAREPGARAPALSVVIGVNAVDYSGYPDCREGFIRAFERAAALGTKAGSEGGEVRVLTPLAGMGKADIVRMGLALGVDFSLTHSCYDPVESGGEWFACASCDACALRRRGFEEAGAADPTRYAPATRARR